MANKRQRKKQQTKKNVDILTKIGKSEKEIKKLKNNIRHVNKLEKTYNKKIKYQQRSDLIKSLGLKVSDHANKRGWSDERFNKWYSREKKKIDDLNDYYLLIFWREKTQDSYVDIKMIEAYKNQYKYMSTDYLIETINQFLRMQSIPGAEIGTSASMVVKGNQVGQYINFMKNVSNTSHLMADSNDWAVVYHGKAKRYKELLLAIHAVIRLLYDNFERASFISKLLEKDLAMINPKMRDRLAYDLKWRGF